MMRRGFRAWSKEQGLGPCSVELLSLDIYAQAFVGSNPTLCIFNFLIRKFQKLSSHSHSTSETSTVGGKHLQDLARARHWGTSR